MRFLQFKSVNRKLCVACSCWERYLTQAVKEDGRNAYLTKRCPMVCFAESVSSCKQVAMGRKSSALRLKRQSQCCAPVYF